MIFLIPYRWRIYQKLMAKICEVYDDRIDLVYLNALYRILERKLEYRASNIANAVRSKTWPYHLQGTHKLFGASIFARQHPNIIAYLNNEYGQNFFDLFQKVCDVRGVDSRRVYLQRIDVNLQHPHCDGTLHIDSNGPQDTSGTTMMVFPNPIWDQDWGGKFQIFSEDKSEMLEEYEYIPGRIISFPSHLPHRGLGPTKEYVYRYSIVFGIK